MLFVGVGADIVSGFVVDGFLFEIKATVGVAMIKAMAAPYHQLKFMPTGGIGTQNLTKEAKALAKSIRP